MSRPWDLATALAGPSAVHPGDTIWLRGGRYNFTQLTSTLQGTAANPIVVRQYPGEQVILDGKLVIQGADTWYWGFEILNSSVSDADLTGLNVQAPGTRLINLIVHDAAGNGVGLWTSAPNAELYGCLIYNNGRTGSAAGRYAHGIYFQNATGTKRLVDNVVFNNYSFNFHGYTEGAMLNNFYLEGNVSFNSGAYVSYGGREYLIGGGAPVQNLTFTHNYSYRGPGGGASTSLGYGGGVTNPAGSVVTNNYLSGDTELWYWQGMTFTDNTLLATGQTRLAVPAPGDLANFTFNNQSYKRPTDVGGFYLNTGGGPTTYTFSGWKTATGFDGASTFSTASPGTKIVVRPNQYEPGRAHVIIYNWDNAPTVNVDLSGVLQSGQAYEIRNVQTLAAPPVASGTYTGGSITLPMAAVTPPPPLGTTEFPALSTGTQFHVFLVRPR